MRPIHYLVIWALAGVVGIFSCQWESEEDFVDPCNSTITWTPAPPDTCFELPITPLGFVDAVMHWPAIKAPYYCPFDTNRFVFVRQEIYPTENAPIYNANLCTGETQLVINTIQLPFPQWGATDWILFNLGNPNASLYKIKSNGDSLTLLSSSTRLRSYFWINNGLAIYARWENSPNEYGLILNPTGEVLDTVPLYISAGAYKNNLLAARGYFQNGNYIAIINLSNWQYTLIQPYDGSSIPASINWLDDETIIWSNTEGIFKANITDHEVINIRATQCDNMRYGPISAASDGSGKLLTTRVEYIYVKPDSLVLYQRISLLDANTGQEWILGLE